MTKNIVEMYCINCTNWIYKDCTLNYKTAQKCVSGLSSSYSPRIDDCLFSQQTKIANELHTIYKKCQDLGLEMIHYENSLMLANSSFIDKLGMKYRISDEHEKLALIIEKYNAVIDTGINIKLFRR